MRRRGPGLKSLLARRPSPNLGACGAHPKNDSRTLQHFRRQAAGGEPIQHLREVFRRAMGVIDHQESMTNQLRAQAAGR